MPGRRDHRIRHVSVRRTSHDGPGTQRHGRRPWRTSVYRSINIRSVAVASRGAHVRPATTARGQQRPPDNLHEGDRRTGFQNARHEEAAPVSSSDGKPAADLVVVANRLPVDLELLPDGTE